MSPEPLLLQTTKMLVVRHSRTERYVRTAAIIIGIIVVLVGLADVSSRLLSAVFGPGAAQEAFAPLPTVVLPGE